MLGPSDSQLLIRCNDEATTPGCCLFTPKKLNNKLLESTSARFTQTDEQDSVMGSRSQLSDIRKIQILGDEETTFILDYLEKARIWRSSKAFFNCSVNIVPEASKLFSQ
jgi:hypothetical protein